MDDRLQHRQGGAAHTAVMFALEEEWRRLAGSARLRRRLRRWGGQDPVLAFDDGHELVAATSGRDAEADRTCAAVLEGLVGRVPGDELALRVAIQVMVPRWCAIADRMTADLDVDERAGMVLELGIYQIVACEPGEADTPMDFRLWANTRRQAYRLAGRHRQRPEQAVGGVGALEEETGPAEQQVDVVRELEPLARWLADCADLPPATGRLIVGTRVGGVSLREAAGGLGVSYDAVRQRRSRGERRCRQRLPAAA